MVLDEGRGLADHLGGRHLTGLQAETGHLVVGLRAVYLDLLEVGGVALDLDGGTGLTDDGHLGVVGEDKDEGGGGVETYLVGETTALDTDGVEFAQAAVGTVDVEFALVEALELAFHAEGASCVTAG